MITTSKIIILGVAFALLSSCQDYKGQIKKQQTTIDSLQTANSELLEVKISMEMKISQLNNEVDNLESEIYTIRKKYAKSSTGDKQAAINAIKYQIKMYHPDVKYRNIRAVSKSDGSVDVILDIIDHINSNKYYNVTTYSNGSYKINLEWGLDFF